MKIYQLRSIEELCEILHDANPLEQAFCSLLHGVDFFSTSKGSTLNFSLKKLEIIKPTTSITAPPTQTSTAVSLFAVNNRIKTYYYNSGDKIREIAGLKCMLGYVKSITAQCKE